ncbi:CPBP family intramembrane glutamic endopeptidase [Aneurinibacillus aneurinilyticus]|jgi:membrane protease YdiL (CAAX protease family)|uniref:CPBP family intramembrane metalloprotease n=2 Tax=Aneurinibacillus aneurinilyticus TaxID=1391 RepID=A0A848CR53_ANEAE|nr:type II CAAX endopeptidase family protein [Aneurinibacillus aneurinilyticus]ERI10080.1 CAAX amino terminal protease family protein [Aneurinibacillus aneurinilyticus ATCC 12856]MCI1693012.1 CPBP family intramembrane metalloprotease [Aneurinibacillus aneurinilyticus]MED0708076.1 type II CAAX endopeptidase family protein [Aneurinibacillus aneurinilyticus]MED0726050.1 type II CAAX endopeptidase family protein [Aneurinibacillus aneurinilyticus]MED0732410.1 type II CAAX endopeptidase family prote
MDPRYAHLDSRTLALNVYISQAILFAFGVAGLYFFYILPGTGWHARFLAPNWIEVLVYGTLVALLVIVIEIILIIWLPPETFDDGGLNELLFRDLPIWHIALVCLVVAVTEEFLFRAVIQPGLGLWWTSVLFALVHVRYLKKWVMTVVVFCISLLFGWLFDRTGSVWSVVWAHFLVDFILGCFVKKGWFLSRKEGESLPEANTEERNENAENGDADERETR